MCTYVRTRIERKWTYQKHYSMFLTAGIYRRTEQKRERRGLHLVNEIVTRLHDYDNTRSRLRKNILRFPVGEWMTRERENFADKWYFENYVIIICYFTSSIYPSVIWWRNKLLQTTETSLLSLYNSIKKSKYMSYELSIYHALYWF